ncbi:MAG TPA: Rrf2 family transcriptional regulator [Noviherbaspirillum sp.]|nr:Rrf2 family transcriptional regulator [Noviherbaspirillum sp.]
MAIVEDYILGNGALHARFFAITEILAKLLSSAPRPVSIAQLEEATGRSSRELAKLCACLARASLLKQDGKGTGRWALSCDASQVTLEDVFRCALIEQQDQQARTKAASKTVSSGASNDVGLLVAQAVIAINQSVFKHLRQFSLDRLKISAAGMYPAPRQQFRDSCLDDAFDVAISGHEALPLSPEQIPA